MLTKFIDDIDNALQAQSENKIFLDKLSKAKINLLSYLSDIFNNLKLRELNELVEGIEIMKKN